MKEGVKLRIRPKEGVIESIKKACGGEAFEVEYYPTRASAAGSTAEYWVKASLMREATTKIAWCSGMRFKMAVESEDQSRINWFMGTVVKNKWWKLWGQLEVTWDKATGRQLEDVKRLNPWMVEPVSTMLPHHLHLSPPAKKICLSRSICPPLLSTTGHQFQVPPPPQQLHCSLGCIQGSRHTDHHSPSFHFKDDDDVACALTIGNGHAPPPPPPAAETDESTSGTSTATLKLFGKKIVVKAEPEFGKTTSGNDHGN